MTNVAENIYTGAADFGKFTASLGAIIVTVIGILFIAAGLIIIFQKRWTPATATITAINGSPTGTCVQTSNGSEYNCSVGLAYNFGKTPMTAVVQYSGSAQRYVGEQITIYIISQDGTNISMDKQLSKGIGAAVIAISLAVMGFAWLGVWVSRKYKFAAAAEGVASAYQMIRG